MRQLHVKTGGTYEKVPSWMHFFLRLGAELARLATAETQRHVIAVAVPTRAYAAALAAAAFCFQTYRARDPREYFDLLASLPEGAVLRRSRPDGRWQHVIFRGLRSEFNRRYIVVQTTRGSKGAGPSKDWIPEDRVTSLHISEHDNVQLPSKGGTGQSLSAALQPGLLAAWLSAEEAQDYAMTLSYDCGIIGQLNLIRNELLSESFSVSGESGFVAGTLQDLVRAKRFASQGEGFRTRLFPDRDPKQLPARGRRGSHPKLAIFDGARAYLKWRLRFSHSQWLVILDRTEREFSAGASQVLADSELGKQIPLNELVLPPGTELIAFRGG